MGLRWPVERTNSRLSNFDGLRSNKDRKSAYRNAQLTLAAVFLVTAKRIDYRDRRMPDFSVIRLSLFSRIASRGPLWVLTLMEMMVEGLIPHR
jgi:hypothetical protein